MVRKLRKFRTLGGENVTESPVVTSTTWSNRFAQVALVNPKKTFSKEKLTGMRRFQKVPEEVGAVHPLKYDLRTTHKISHHEPFHVEAEIDLQLDGARIRMMEHKQGTLRN